MSLAAHNLPEPAGTVEYTIGELARMHNVSLRTLRFYEDKDLLKPRRVGNSRFYSLGDSTRLEVVLTGKRLGFTLAEIRALIESRSGKSELAHAEFSTTLSKAELEKQIRVLSSRRDELNGAIEELNRVHDQYHGSNEGTRLRVVDARAGEVAGKFR